MTACAQTADAEGAGKEGGMRERGGSGSSSGAVSSSGEKGGEEKAPSSKRRGGVGVRGGTVQQTRVGVIISARMAARALGFPGKGE